MLQTIGFMIAAYCTARLIQAPMELPDGKGTWLAVLLVSIIGIAVIGLLTFMLATQGLDLSSQMPGLSR